MALQGASVVCDAFLPNLQAALFKVGASRLEVTFYTNMYVFFIMTLLVSSARSNFARAVRCPVLTVAQGGGSGHIVGAFNFAMQDSMGGVLLLLYTIVAYVAIRSHLPFRLLCLRSMPDDDTANASCSFHMKVVEKFGSVVAVLVGNARKVSSRPSDSDCARMHGSGARGLRLLLSCSLLLHFLLLVVSFVSVSIFASSPCRSLFNV
eukprot:1551156-Rhodomonas_salina.4